jgi:hypothetical protein
MKKNIQLCGFGNGLVDLQYTITDLELAELGLKKGDMVLVDSEKQSELLNKLSHITHNRCSGGSAANSIIAFAQLGGKPAYQTVLGNDDYGKFYANEFSELNITLESKSLDEYSTGTCVVLITPDGERTMHNYLGATAYFRPEYIDEELIKQSEWLYIEGYEFSQDWSTEAIFKAIECAKANNTKIAISFSADFIITVFRDNLQKAVKDADLVFCNESEAMNFTATDNYESAYDVLSAMCPNVVVTLGKKGAIYKWEEKTYYVPAYSGEVIDTTGAGDMFAGAFFFGIINDYSPIVAGHLASFASGRIVAQFGARINDNMIELKNKVYNEIIPNLN